MTYAFDAKENVSFVYNELNVTQKLNSKFIWRNICTDNECTIESNNLCI